MNLDEARDAAMVLAQLRGRAIDVYLDTETGQFEVLDEVHLNKRSLRHIGMAWPEQRPVGLVMKDGAWVSDGLNVVVPAGFTFDRD